MTRGQEYEYARSIGCYFCFGCGAMVRDRERHDRFHQALSDVPRVIAAALTGETP